MLGLLTAISVAAAGVAKHLMDLNDAEMEKQKRDKEIRRLQEELEEEQRRKRELQDEVDHQRLLKNISESNTIHYIKGMGEVMDMRADLAEILANLSKDDPGYEEMIIESKEVESAIDDHERITELNFGKDKPRNMTMEEMYIYYLQYLKKDEEQETAQIEAAATTEEIKRLDKELMEHINRLKSELADMEKHLVNDGSNKYLQDLQDIKDTKEKIMVLERRLSDNRHHK